jgi:putative protease
MDKKEIGRIAHYFPKVGVAVVALSADLKKGDLVTIGGKSEPFDQTIQSMQIEKQEIPIAKKGQMIGLKVEKPVHEGDIIWR